MAHFFRESDQIWAKFRHFGENLKVFGNFLGFTVSISHNFEPTLAFGLCIWANFQWPNIEETIWLTGHTGQIKVYPTFANIKICKNDPFKNLFEKISLG